MAPATMFKTEKLIKKLRSWLLSLLTPTTVAGVKRSSAFVCESVSVCTHDNSKMNDPKEFKVGTGNDFGISYKWYDFGIKRSKVKVTESQSAKTY